MDKLHLEFLQSIRFGEPQTHRNMAVVPLFVTNGEGPDYLTLSEAMEQRLLVVKEISEGGSVPDLRVENKADRPVLLLDGEELAGAKQNRVLNTSILVKGNSSVVVPVSCTEQGRWSYLSPEFMDSGTVMAASMRLRKTASVSASLRGTETARADQGEVWQEIDELSEKAQVRSGTLSMRDIFEARKRDLKGYENEFGLQDGQNGLLVIIGDRAIGFDIVSKHVAFARLHQKVVSSYAMDAMLDKSKSVSENVDEMAREFLQVAGTANQSVHESVGLGQDFRFTGSNIVGSALTVEDAVIHMAFFRSEESDRKERMSSARRRRGFRL